MKIPQKGMEIYHVAVAYIEKMTTFLSKRRTITACTVLFKAFLDLVYPTVAAYWEYYGFAFKPNFLGILVSWFVFLISYIAVDDVIEHKNSNARPIFLILSYINFFPMLTLFGYGAISVRTLIYGVVYYALIYFFAFRFNWRFWKKDCGKCFSKTIQFPVLAWIIGLGCCLAIVLISGYYANFRFSLNLEDVYKWREENKQSMSVLARYIFGAAIACNVTMLSYCLSKKKYVIALVLVAIQIMAFSVDGLKSTLFVMAFAMVALVYWGNSIERMIPAALMGVSCIGFLENVLLKSMFVINHLLRRSMLLTGIITDHYVDFFSKNTPDFFMQGPLRFLGLESQYEREISYLIGTEYYVEGINFNSGLVSEAVANLGVVGVVVMPVMIALFLKVYGKITKGLPNSVVFASSLYIAWFLLSSTLTTTIASHGVFALMILLACLPKEKSKERRMAEEVK